MIEYSKISLSLLVMFSMVICFTCKNPKQSLDSSMKFNPGHYVAVGPYFNLSEIKHLQEPSLRGINKRYFWRTLEANKDEYDFSLIQEDLDFCASEDKQFVLFLCDKSFWIKSALPEYMREYELNKEGQKFLPIRWYPDYVERFVALGKAIGEKFDSHPNFEGIAIQETALDITEENLQELNYSPDLYRDALIAILKGLKNAMPNSKVFWYQNGMHDNSGHLRQIADTFTGSNVVMGGPDILPYRRWLRHTYKIYPEYKDKLTLFCSAQDDSFKHHKNDIRYSDKRPVHEEGYLSMDDIFLYARDQMHVKYLFWNYYYEGEENGERSFDDAIKTIRKYPTFNLN